MTGPRRGAPPVVSRPRRQRGGLGAGLATLGILAVLAASLAPGSAALGQDPEPEPEADSELSLTGVAQTPWVVRDGTWSLELDVAGAPADGEVRARILERLDDRQAYNEALFGVVNEARKASIPAVPLATAPLTPTGARRVRLAVTLRSEGSSRPGWAFLSEGLRSGVYPVDVEVRDGDGSIISSELVFLTRVPSGPEAAAQEPPLRVATVVPVAAAPTVDGAGEVDLPEEVVDSALAVGTGLSVVPDLPVTIVPRPETVEALARGDEGVEALEALQTAIGGRQVVDGPYVDLPLDEMVAAGLRDEVTRHRERGNSILTRHLGPPDSSTYLGPRGLTGDAASQLWDVGVRTVILPPGSVEDELTAPIAVAAGAGRTLQGVVADGGLTAALDRTGDPVLDDAGLAAELALIAAESESVRGVLVLPDEAWPADAEAFARLAAVLQDPAAPVRPVTVAGLVAEVPGSGPRALVAEPAVDLGDHPLDLTTARGELSSLASLTGPDDPAIAILDQRLLLSSERSLDLDERSAYVGSVRRSIDRRFDAVEAPPRQTITLTSNEGDVPLTLRNNLDRPVSVLLELDADSRVVLREGPSMVVTLQPGTNTIDIPVEARVPGDSAVDVRIRTPDGAVDLDEVRYTVRSTAISGLGLVLSIGAAAFLLLWWARHWRRSRRDRGGRDEGGDDDDGPGPDPVPAPDPVGARRDDPVPV